jgi:hypothetical protein
MSYSKFTLALKSSLDFYAKQLADSKGMPFVDLAAETFSKEVLESDQPAICWDFSSVRVDPVDPMYTVMFDIGIMTFLDPSQYVALDLVSMFLDAFQVGKRFTIRDYSGVVTPTTDAGYMLITASAITPQQADSATGLRFVTVTAKAIRNV